MYIELFTDDYKVNLSNLLSEDQLWSIFSHETYLPVPILSKLHTSSWNNIYIAHAFLNTSFSRWYHYLWCSVAFWRGLCSRGVHNLHCADSDRTADGCLDDKNLALGHGCSWSVQFGNLYRFSHRFAELLW